MNANVPTPRRARDAALVHKQTLRAGMSLYGLSVPQLGDLLGVEDDNVEAWLSPTRPNHVPAWIYDHPNFPRPLRDFVRAESDRLAGDAPTHGAETPEAQSVVALRTVGQFIVAVASVTMADPRMTSEAAAQLLVIGEKTITTLAALCARLRQRVVTGRQAVPRVS